MKKLPEAPPRVKTPAENAPIPEGEVPGLPEWDDDGWRVILGDYLRTLTLNCCEDYVSKARAKLRMFLRITGVGQPRGITPKVVSDYLAKLQGDGKSPKTLQNYLTHVSGLCRFLVARGFLKRNPCRDVRRPKDDELLPGCLSDAEIRRTLGMAKKLGIWPEVQLALATGLRVGELARLCWPDVDMRRRILTVRKSKSGRPRTVPLSGEALAALRAQRRKVPRGFNCVFPARQTFRGGERLHDRSRSLDNWDTLLEPIKRAVPAFQVRRPHAPGRGWHMFRSTLASRLARAGASIFKIANILGHRDVNMTARRYACLAADYDDVIELAGLRKGVRR